jgi:ankyrin repeat protein
VTAQKREQRLQERPESLPDISEVVVTGHKAAKPAPAADFVVSPRAAARGAEKLRAAAAAGRTGELSALLDQGVPVDAPDAEGETALMKSIQADKPAAAALLRRRGANLDRRNNDGDSARDMAAALEDAELDKALGLEP